MDSLESLSYSALGSRTKRFSDYCFEQVRQVYEALSIAFEPPFYPYVSYIQQFAGGTIADLSKGLGVSHSAASKMVKRLVEEQLVLLKDGKADKRTKKLFLTQKAEQEFFVIQPVLSALNAVMANMDGTEAGLLDSLKRYEKTFVKEPLSRRVLKYLTQTLPLQVKSYHSGLHAFYETHNRIWIQRNFILEPVDIAHLGDPDTHVLTKGGKIYIYCLGDYPVGGFSLLDDGNGVMQLSKMYVPEALHGYGIGNKMLSAAIETARTNNCSLLYLLSNTKQAAAIHLYRKTGFVEVPMSPESKAFFQRANIKMEMRLAA